MPKEAGSPWTDSKSGHGDFGGTGLPYPRRRPSPLQTEYPQSSEPLTIGLGIGRQHSTWIASCRCVSRFWRARVWSRARQDDARSASSHPWKDS